jgi:hypothetical protein
MIHLGEAHDKRDDEAHEDSDPDYHARFPHHGGLDHVQVDLGTGRAIDEGLKVEEEAVKGLGREARVVMAVEELQEVGCQEEAEVFSF